MSTPPIWVVRPEPGNNATMRRLAAQGLPAHSVPLFQGEPLPWTTPPSDNFDALMLTSANALRHAGQELACYGQLPLWAVGATTASAAHDAGLAVSRVGNGGVAELLEGAKGRILWLCGEARTTPPAHAGLTVTPVPVYRMAETSVLPDRFGTKGIILLHSVRAARRIAGLVCDHRGTFTLVAISAEVANAAGDGWQCVRVASSPTDAEVVAVTAQLCQ